MGFQSILDGIGLILMLIALFALFFGVTVIFSPVVMFDVGAALYIVPRILYEWFGGGYGG